MSHKIKFIIAGSILLLSVFVFTPVSAQYGLDETANSAGLSTYGSSLPNVIGSIIGTALSMIAVVFFALMVFAGFMWMTDHGNEEQAKKAKSTIFAAITGILIVLGAYALTNFIFKTVPGGGGEGITSNVDQNLGGGGGPVTEEEGGEEEENNPQLPYPTAPLEYHCIANNSANNTTNEFCQVWVKDKTIEEKEEMCTDLDNPQTAICKWASAFNDCIQDKSGTFTEFCATLNEGLCKKTEQITYPYPSPCKWVQK